jgi:gliding motility-associated-like protein
MGVFPCLNPELWDRYSDTLCLNETLVDSIVVQKDFSKNGGGLIPRSTLSLFPKHGQVTVIDTVNKVFTYQPEPGFYGRDSIGFTVCDTSLFQRCSDKKIFITVLYTNNGPLVLNEYYTEYRNTSISGNILSNDSDPDNDTLYVLDPVVDLPKNGNVSVSYDGYFEYVPYHGFIGKDSMVVTVCDYASMTRCAQSICQPDTVYFTILPNRIFVPDGFSPNGDNNHDEFVIRTDAPSQIHFIAYNRWGNIVYEDKNYNNNWDGVANRGLVIGKGVPDGTYYIYYNINDGEFEGFKYITLNR